MEVEMEMGGGGQLPPQKKAAAAAAAAAVEAKSKERPFRGIRMRKWGKWVAEIREPNKRSRIWLGSYCTPVAAAKAYDTALFYLRGRAARLNFPDDISVDSAAAAETAMSAASIRKKAAEVGAKVDALQMSGEAAAGFCSRDADRNHKRCKNPDLNQEPTPECSDADDDDEEQWTASSGLQ